MSARVLVKERIAQAGIDLLRRRFDVDVAVEMPAEELAREIGGYDALVVRSATRVTPELLERAERLRVIGRAGTGVDNVDVAEATRRGIIVANAPGSNMVSAAEHAIGLMLALARNIPQAHAALREGRWERSRFGGVEVCDKTLAVIGFGRIGQLVSIRARGLGMRVVAYDPFVTEERFREVQVEHAAKLADALAGADFVTLHAPLSAETEQLVRAETLALMRPGVRIVNAARGGLVDLDALADALESGHVAGAAVDVFPTEPYTAGRILGLDNVVVTPHLGASTREAQDRAGVIVAEQVAAALSGELVSNAVNIPQVGAEAMAVLRPFIPLAEQLGQLAAGLAPGQVGRLDLAYSGALAAEDTRILTAAALTGLLKQHSDEPVNLVNARAVAHSRGIDVTESRTAGGGDFTNLMTVRSGAGPGVGGTTIGAEHRPWLVCVDGLPIEIQLGGPMLVLRNADRPGMIGAVGTLLGAEGVNIANMNVSREVPATEAVMVLALDTRPTAETLRRLEGLDGIRSVRFVCLNGA